MNILETIVGERICICPFERKDFDPFYNFMTNKKSTQYLLFEEEQKTEDGKKAFFGLRFSSCTNYSDKFAGSIRVRILSKDNRVAKCA